MNLNPFYHFRRYRELEAKLLESETFNESLLERNRDLEQDLAHARTELDKANRKIDYLTSEFEELQSEFVILVNAKKLTRKEARELRNHKYHNHK